MKLSHDRFITGVRIKGRPKSLTARAAFLLFVEETCFVNIRCNDPTIKFGLYTLAPPVKVKAGEEIRGLIQLDYPAKRGQSVDFSLILAPEESNKILVTEMEANGE